MAAIERRAVTKDAFFEDEMVRVYILGSDQDPSGD
jgi:hypothetical protein